MIGLTDIARHLACLLPPRWREGAKRGLGALGHKPGWAQILRARHYARSSKRLDVVAGYLLPRLLRHGVRSLKGQRVLEFGVGHLMSEPMVVWLAGASSVSACDYFPILQPQMIADTVRHADRNALESTFAAYGAAESFAARFPALERIGRDGLSDLAALGLSYHAPVDHAWPQPSLGSFDLIHSISVLEHVPAARAGDILANLYASLGPGGRMLHAIHMEDHRDFVNAPFAFLASDTDFTPDQADDRGNRLRASDWLQLARVLPGAEVTMLEPARRDPALLPARLGPEFADRERDMLVIGGMTLSITKAYMS